MQFFSSIRMLLETLELPNYWIASYGRKEKKLDSRCADALKVPLNIWYQSMAVASKRLSQLISLRQYLINSDSFREIDSASNSENSGLVSISSNENIEGVNFFAIVHYVFWMVKVSNFGSNNSTILRVQNSTKRTTCLWVSADRHSKLIIFISIACDPMWI